MSGALLIDDSCFDTSRKVVGATHSVVYALDNDFFLGGLPHLLVEGLLGGLLSGWCWWSASELLEIKPTSRTGQRDLSESQQEDEAVNRARWSACITKSS